MSEIKGKGIPTRQTKGALGDIYTDTTTGVKYKCTGAYGVSTHAESKKDYEWKPVNPVAKNLQRTAEEKPHETPKKQTKVKAKAAEKIEEKTEEKVEDAGNAQETSKKDAKSGAKHNYTKHFEEGKDAE